MELDRWYQNIYFLLNRVTAFLDGTPIPGTPAISTYAQTLLDDTTAAAARATLLINGHRSSDYASLSAAITAIGSTSCTLIIDTNQTVSTNVTIPSTCSVIVQKGAIITVASSKTLTITGPLEAGMYQVFDCVGTGSVSGLDYANVIWFGAVGDGIIDDRDSCQLAIDSIIEYGTVYFPARLNYYKIGLNSLTDALTVSKTSIIIIDGELRSTNHTYQTNPAYIINITASKTIIKGSGILRGDGGYLSVSTDLLKIPGLLRITNTDCDIEGITFVNPPQTAIFIAGHNTTINNCKFTGGPLLSEVPSPQHFYIALWSGNDINITNNLFYRDSDGRATRQGIWGPQSIACYNLSVLNNRFIGLHEHAIYVGAYNSQFSNNVIEYTQDASEQEGNAIATYGNNLIISNNIIRNAAAGGIGARNSNGSIISNNNLYNVGLIGIDISEVHAVLRGFSNNIISNNYLLADSSGTMVYCGIRLRILSGGYPCQNNKILNNTLIGWGSTSYFEYTSISVTGNVTSPFEYCEISGNSITGSNSYGCLLQYFTKSKISNNRFYDNPLPNFRAMYVGAGSGDLIFENNLIEDNQDSPTLQVAFYNNDSLGNWDLVNNKCYNSSFSNPFSYSVSQNIQGYGNCISSNDKLRGQFTINGVSSLVINNENIISEGLTDCLTTIRLEPLNTYATAIMGSSKCLYVSDKVNKTSFTVSTGDGTTVAENDAIFSYEIIQ